MSIAEKAIAELGERLIDTVFDYMIENKDLMMRLSPETQDQIISLSLTGVKISIKKTLNDKMGPKS